MSRTERVILALILALSFAVLVLAMSSIGSQALASTRTPAVTVYPGGNRDGHLPGYQLPARWGHTLQHGGRWHR